MTTPTEALTELQEVAAFLDGSAPMEGHWYGDEHAPRYWWRAPLRAAVAKVSAALAQAEQPEPQTLPVEVYGEWYEVPIPVQIHITHLRMKQAEQPAINHAPAWFGMGPPNHQQPDAGTYLFTPGKGFEKLPKQAEQPAEQAQPVAALLRSRSVTTWPHTAVDGKTHYSEWGDWLPTTYKHAKAVTDPSRNTDPACYEMKPLYAAPPAAQPAVAWRWVNNDRCGFVWEPVLAAPPAAHMVAPTDEQLSSLFGLVHEFGEFGSVFCQEARRILAAPPAAQPLTDTRKPCTCDGAGRGPGRACVVKAGGRLGELWRCAEGIGTPAQMVSPTLGTAPQEGGAA